ncbi:TadE/TadG family type IV pilus assembly protein [Altererythrobacter lutimaris]|uniref:Pilus assembly protein n=1 Tax=Altererythrobacter lutimaris TaxID=2743979 RepID=A0A850H8R4_9SPHN|nr:pilus assembly protein TadG-related protein [Altererythrobacter lutimaris]NVE94179.1 pilus assembly protein [Altererythrobacter lutimaris]
MTQHKVKPFKAKRFWQDQNGAVAATYALALIPIIALAGLAFDYTRLAGMDTELQNAADQAALAGATQLDRRAGAINRATAAIQGGLVANETFFANDSADQTVDVTDVTQIVFYPSRADAEAGTNPVDKNATDADSIARFVEVTVDTRAANYALTPIVGAVSGSINAQAVAGLGSAICRIPPLMVCNPDEPETGTVTTETPFDIASRIGDGLLTKPGGGSGGWGPGVYGYLSVGGDGANEVRRALGWNTPTGNCISQDGVDEELLVDNQPGNIASGPAAINTRFDIYEANGCVDGNGNCSPAFNVRKDLVRPANAANDTNSCKIQGGEWTEPANPYRPTDLSGVPATTTIDSMGHPRDICHALEDSNPLNCKDDFFGNGVWDRAAYFRTHYGAAFNWQGNGMLGPNVTRYETYLYEINNHGTALADTPAGAAGNQLTTRNKAVCGPALGAPASTSTDRRVMSVAVINCRLHNVNGRERNLPVLTWMDVFLVQPSLNRASSGKWTGKDDIYVEIIREVDISNSGTSGGPLIRRDQPYLVR